MASEISGPAFVHALISSPIEDLADECPFERTATGLALIGTLCSSCGLRVIGRRVVCSKCVGQNVEIVALSQTGTLYSYTTVHVGNPAGEPRILGYVDLDDGVRTLAEVRVGTIALEPDLLVKVGIDGEAWFVEPAETYPENPRNGSNL